ncbi:Metacaspase-1 [Hibiscus syriacus]|uniref:Metacaspase-1 n=1 Tax=Hibiscus syriacus TaxID=106335 RepID=A0A6A2YEH7_HIBSY|nr:Metacaspase-1 [Hibiscus syriacus]
MIPCEKAAMEAESDKRNNYFPFPDDEQLSRATGEEETNRLFIQTRKNIEDSLRWLVKDCQPGDSLVFFYSGHGLRVPDFNNDEVDGFDETICPLDFKEVGTIKDNDLNSLIVRPLTRGVTLHAIVDACHSGTTLDLPKVYNSTERKWEDNSSPSGVYKGLHGWEDEQCPELPFLGICPSMLHLLTAVDPPVGSGFNFPGTSGVSDSMSGSTAAVVTQFSKLETLKLSKSNFILWKHQILLIIDGYGLLQFLSSTSSALEQFVLFPDGLLADVWTAVSRLYGAQLSTKVSALFHVLDSQKKRVNDHVILAGLPVEYELRNGVNLSSLTEMLLDCEARHKSFFSDNLLMQSSRGHEPRGRMMAFVARGVVIRGQCQLCGRFGHVVQKYYFRFDLSFHGNVANSGSCSHDDGGSSDVGGRQEQSTASQTQSVHQASPQALVHAVNSVGHGIMVHHLTCLFLFPLLPHLLVSPRKLDRQVLFATMTPFLNSTMSNDHYWYLDSGATHHITNDRRVLQSETPYAGLDRWLASHGVKHRVSCSHTSEQNGKAECKQRHIVEMGLTLLAQAPLSIQLWSYAFVTIVFLINRRLVVPVILICGLLISTSYIFKLESVFLGYSVSYKGYKCLDENEEAGTSTSEYWTMNFDGALNALGYGVRAIFISPKGDQYPFIRRLNFDCTNNMAEYEACVL